MWVFLVYLLFWFTGLTLLAPFVGRTGLASELPMACLRRFSPFHIMAGLFIGLALNAATMFSLNQLANFKVNEVSLFSIAIFWLVVAAVLAWLIKPTRSSEIPRRRGNDERWSVWAVGLLATAVGLFCFRTGQSTLWQPLSDWDTFLYHLDFGRQVAEGSFPSNIGRSATEQVMQAYPPLFYFVYGLNQMASSELTYFMPRLTVALVNVICLVATYVLGRDRFELGRPAASLATLILASQIDVIPNMQSLTMAYLVLAMYFTWPMLRGTHDATGRERFWTVTLSAICWAGCAWANYVGVAVTGLFFGIGICVTLAARSCVNAKVNSHTAETSEHACDPDVSELRGVPGGLPQPGLLLVTGVLALVMLSPFLVRNTLAAGNPIYPAAPSVLGDFQITNWFIHHSPNLQNTPVTVDTFHEAVRRGMPYLVVLLSALACLPFLSQRRGIRVTIALWIVAYLAVWLLVLNPIHAPSWRYLGVLVPIGSLLVAGLVDRLTGCSGEREVLPVWLAAVLGLVLLVMGFWRWYLAIASWRLGLIFALLLALPFVAMFVRPRRKGQKIEASGPSDAKGFITRGVIAAVAVGGWFAFLRVGLTKPIPSYAVIIAWAIITGLALGLSFIKRRAHKAGSIGDAVESAPAMSSTQNTMSNRVPFSIHGGAVVLLVAAAGLIGTFYKANPRMLNRGGLPIDTALLWMNANLPDDALILTMEGRTFKLHRQIMPADDVRIESLYIQPPDGDESAKRRADLETLRALGVTHVYNNQHWKVHDYFVSKPLLLPTRDNPNLKLLFNHADGGWVAEIIYP